jgi:hypothetical protein
MQAAGPPGPHMLRPIDAAMAPPECLRKWWVVCGT